jgi:hypothetical protein
VVASAALSMTFCCPDTFGAELVLPHYCVDGYKTNRVYINPTDGPLVPVAGRFGSIAPRSSFSEPLACSDAGVRSLEIADGLIVYSEIVTPVGGVLQVGPLQPLTSARFYALKTSDGWNGGLFIGALADTVARVVGGAEASIFAGKAIILPPFGAITEIENRLTFGTQGAAPIYAFGFSNHHRTYTLLVVPAR